jgi:hypothetical protein
MTAIYFYTAFVYTALLTTTSLGGKMEIHDLCAMTFSQFCRRHNISLSYLYELINTGMGPRTMRIGKKRLITADAAKEWCARFEEPAKIA